MYVQEGREFEVSNGTVWKVRCRITCSSLNVIYFLKCNYCKLTTKLGKTDNLRRRTNNHRSACRLGTSTDVFDNHVFACHQNLGLQRMEPEFFLFCLMACSDYNKLLSYERDMHLKNFDTTFQLSTTWTFFTFFHTLCQVLSIFRLLTFYLLCPVERNASIQFFIDTKILVFNWNRSFFSASSFTGIYE